MRIILVLYFNKSNEGADYNATFREMNEEQLARVFEEFQQAESSTSCDYGGTGLGSPISKQLAQLLGGDLTAATVEGEGSTSTLSIPMRLD